MNRSDRKGFTFVEIMTAMALFAVLVLIAWGKYNNTFKHRALEATMITDLRNLTTAQELFYELNLTYSTNLAALEIHPSPESQIYITEAGPAGWAAWNEIDGSPKRCEIFVGGDSTAPLGFAAASERIVCEESEQSSVGS